MPNHLAMTVNNDEYSAIVVVDISFFWYRDFFLFQYMWDIYNSLNIDYR